MDDQKHAAMFMQLVFTFQTAAWQQMGKIKNPMTDQVERDLNQARFSIDILEMIRAKTQGNLSEDEKRFLDHTLSELQLNYVSEANEPQEEGKAEATASEAEKEPAAAPEEPPQTESEDKKQGKPKTKSSKKKNEDESA